MERLREWSLVDLYSASIAQLRALGGAPNTPEFIPLSLHAGDSRNTHLVELGTWVYLPSLTVFISFQPLDYKYRYTAPKPS
jgi:hypothetical protein